MAVACRGGDGCMSAAWTRAAGSIRVECLCAASETAEAGWAMKKRSKRGAAHGHCRSGTSSRHLSRFRCCGCPRATSSAHPTVVTGKDGWAGWITEGYG